MDWELEPWDLPEESPYYDIAYEQARDDRAGFNGGDLDDPDR